MIQTTFNATMLATTAKAGELSEGYQPSRLIDADKIKTMDDVRLLFKAMSMQVNPQAPMYSELEHLLEQET